MQIHYQKEGDILVVSIQGHVDALTAVTLETELLAAIDGGERRMILDGTAMEYINSAGLKALLVTAKRLDVEQGRFVICSLAANVRMIFDMIGFDRIMTIVPGRAEALQLLADQQAAA